MICAQVPLKEVGEFELDPGEPNGWKSVLCAAGRNSK